MEQSVVCVLCALACLSVSLAAPDNAEVKNGEEARLGCNNTKLWNKIGGSTAMMRNIQWVLPNGDVLSRNSSSIEIRNHELGIENFWLIVPSVQDSDWGVYTCVLTINQFNEPFAVVRSINIDGPPAIDIWAKYEQNVIIGASAGGGFFVVACLMCLLYHCQYEKRMEKRKQKSDGLEPLEYGDNAPDNAAYEGTEPVEHGDSARYNAPYETTEDL